MALAKTVQEIPNACNLDPLKGKDLEDFYVETMPARTGDDYESPMADIFIGCQEIQERNAFLLMGHRGCGKSTELNKMAAELAQEGYPIRIIQCGRELDLRNITHTDLLILMGDALLDIAAEKNISLDETLEERIRQYWRGTITQEEENDSTFGAELMSKLSAGAGIKGILSFLLDVKSDIRFSETKREIYRTMVEKRSSEWLQMLRRVIDSIAGKTCKQPILIFEELDKLEPAAAWRVFYNYSDTLSSLPIPIIYTFPISLSYDPQFAALSSFFKVKMMPMIKIMYPNGDPCESGKKTIEDIVAKRMDTSLFQEDTLTYLIEKTGGSLRDLFTAIIASSRRANRRKSATVAEEDARSALSGMKSDLTRRIDQENDYDFLVRICKGNRKRIENKELLLRELQAGVVLEYNGTHWHNVHPLVEEFLREQGLVEQ